MRVAALVLSVAVCALACTPRPAGSPATGPGHATAPRDLARLYVSAHEREAVDPLSFAGYLAVVDAAVEQPDDAWALPALHAAVDALLWRQSASVHSGHRHALVHRSRSAAITISKRLQRAYAKADRQQKPQSVWMRMVLAAGLSGLALRVGDGAAAKRWRRRSGCIKRAALVGPLAPHALAALSGPSPVPHNTPFAAHFSGVPPFAARVKPEIHYADACSLPLGASSPLSGMHVAVVDIANPQAQRLHFAVTSEAATRIELGGKQLLVRRNDRGSSATTQFASAMAAEGKLRLVIRSARPYGRIPVSVRILTDTGEALPVDAPHAGDVADATASQLQSWQASKPTSDYQRALAIAAALARGDNRAANASAEQPDAPKPGAGPLAFDVLRMSAIKAAHDADSTTRQLRLEGLAQQLLTRCPQCWEARLSSANALRARTGYGTGDFKALQSLGVTAGDQTWLQRLSVMDLLWITTAASSLKQHDIARSAFDALAQRIPGSFLVADVDAALHQRVGIEAINAACHGGTSRATSACASAQLAQGNVYAAQTEMKRLRRLRGDPATLRLQEMLALLTKQRKAEAMDIYRALSAGERSLSLLGAWYGDDKAQGAAANDDQVHSSELRAILRRNLATARDAPRGLQPLARLLGHVPDRSSGFEQQGASLVARDRKSTFLPGAGTAVLQHVELYDLEPSGLLHYWLYDLRRVSGTADVADGTWFGAPMVDGRSQPRVLRRRIYKRDGRVLDPDPRSGGRQSQTDLSQLQTGDYVEVVVESWGLPRANGQLVVDTADLLPQRTSVRHAEIQFRRPTDLALAVWTHPRLGTGKTQRKGNAVTTSWNLRAQKPRTMEGGVPPLLARVALSFGTDSYARIGRSFGEHLRGLRERDPYVTRWVQQATTGASDDRQKVDKLVTAVGKAIVRGDSYMLSDAAVSIAAGPQRDTARTMLERGDGSRCWVIHRALQELGIDSTLAIAETRPYSAAPGFPARPGRFDHALVRATLLGKQVWIDADVEGPPLPPGRISPELRGRQALLPNGDIVAVTSDAAPDIDDIEVTLTLLPNGDASGVFRATIHGRPAQRLSDALEKVVGAERTTMLRNVVLGWLPWADVRAVNLAASSSSWRLVIDAEVAAVGLAQPEQRSGQLRTIAGTQPLHLIHPRAQAATLASWYARRATRTTPLAINQAQLYRFKRTIELPPGSKLVRTPKATTISAAAGSGAPIIADRKLTASDTRITETFSLNLPVTTVTAADYPAFAEQVRRIDDTFLHSYGIQLPAKP